MSGSTFLPESERVIGYPTEVQRGITVIGADIRALAPILSQLCEQAGTDNGRLLSLVRKALPHRVTVEDVARMAYKEPTSIHKRIQRCREQGIWHPFVIAGIGGRLEASEADAREWIRKWD